MSVKVRKWKRGGWEVDIRSRWPDGTEFRDRKVAPMKNRSDAQRWGEDRERCLLAAGKPNAEEPQGRKEVPTLAEFAPRFVKSHAVANRQKASGVATTERLLRLYLLPRLGGRRLNEIRTEDIQRLKADLPKLSPKTINNILATLGKMLRVAVEWEEIERMPCSIRMLKTPRTEMEFYDFEEYERLLAAARSLDKRAELIVLLGGDAGLRVGEMTGLEWGDIDLKAGRVHIRRSVWKGHVDTPKNGKSRIVGLTDRLAQALKSYQSRFKGERVLCEADGSPTTEDILRCVERRTARKAGLAKRGIHILRHSFASHLAMLGASPSQIQAGLGHSSIQMAMRYTHLTPESKESVYRLLDGPRIDRFHGDILETDEARAVTG